MAFTAPTLLLDWDRLRALLPADTNDRLHTDEVFAESCVAAAQSALDVFLGTPAFLHTVTQYATAGTVRYDPGPATYGIYATDRPVSIVRTSGVTTASGVLSYTTTPTDSQFDYLAGWIRDGQTAAALTAALGLSGDDVVTEAEAEAALVVPLAVEVALAQYAQAYAAITTSGTLGLSSRTQDWGQNQTTTQGPRFDHLPHLFRPLAHYRVPRL